jgi:hypothetical protein
MAAEYVAGFSPIVINDARMILPTSVTAARGQTR